MSVLLMYKVAVIWFWRYVQSVLGQFSSLIELYWPRNIVKSLFCSSYISICFLTKTVNLQRCVSELLDLYQNDDVLTEICQNTERKVAGKVNWPCIILTVHKLVTDVRRIMLKSTWNIFLLTFCIICLMSFIFWCFIGIKIIQEAEKPSKETNAKNNERQSLSSLVIDTIRRSNERSAEFLRSSEIVAIILQILDSKVYVHYQDTYLGILVKYILPKSTNHSNITTEQWRELLIVCTKLYKKTHLQSYIVLDALQMIVDYSFLHTNLLPHVKNLLLFLGMLKLDSSKLFWKYICVNVYLQFYR